MSARLHDTESAASYLGFESGTLENWRYQGRGPRFIHIGRSVRYDQADLDAWVDAMKVAS